MTRPADATPTVCEWCEDSADEVCPDGGRCPSCQDWGCEACMTEADRNIAIPLPSAPRFAIGDPVWAFNSQPRVVTGMRWGQARARRGEPQRQMPWGWVLDTVHLDDPTCKGCGFEAFYQRRP